MSLGLTEQEKKTYLRRLGFTRDVPSNEEIDRKVETLVQSLKENNSEGSSSKIDEIREAGDRLIAYNNLVKEFDAIPNKRISNLSILKATITERKNNNPTENFATATSREQQDFSSSGEIKAKTTQKTLPEDFEDRFNSNLNRLGFSGTVPLVGSTVTGFIAGANIARIMSIPGNVLVRLGTSNDLTEKELAKVGIAAAEAAIVNSEDKSLELSHFVEETTLSKEVKALARKEGFSEQHKEKVSSQNIDESASPSENLPTSTPLRMFNPSPLSLKPTSDSSSGG